MSQAYSNLTLLDDIDRSRAFFSIFPETAFLKNLEALEEGGFYSRDFKTNLADYIDFKERPSATFANKYSRELFEKFDASLAELMHFVSINLFVDGKIFVLHPELKKNALPKYNKLQTALSKLASTTKNDYLKLTYSLTSTSALPAKRTRVSFEDGVVQLGKSKYEPSSKLTLRLLETLWPLGTTRSKQKDAESITIGNLAVKIGLSESSTAFAKNPKRLKELIKNTNGYLIKKKLPVHIEIKGDLVYLIVE